ncbi:MAG: sugar transferase [Fimbriimonas sp.]|nr:sugar transferase [Fimbriimonas sp.]
MAGHQSIYGRFGKRCLDIVLASTALIVLSPLLLVLWLIGHVAIGRPVLFRQTRPGRDDVLFDLIKFRSMNNRRGQDGELLPDRVRMTAYGRFLRATSLDELPELWNVLRGDMSLVGPRPLLERYLSRYTPEQRRRHQVLPGLTGWAQVHGRNMASWADRFSYDIWYIDHVSLGLDLRIIAMTIVYVIRRVGIHSAESETVPEFMGEAQPHSAKADS